MGPEQGFKFLVYEDRFHGNPARDLAEWKTTLEHFCPVPFSVSPLIFCFCLFQVSSRSMPTKSVSTFKFWKLHFKTAMLLFASPLTFEDVIFGVIHKSTMKNDVCKRKIFSGISVKDVSDDKTQTGSKRTIFRGLNVSDWNKYRTFYGR